MFVLIKISSVILMANLIGITYSIATENKYFRPKDNSHLEVRAVIVKCEIRDGKDTTLESDITRFQREELFKHNALRDCKQKLTLTVKATSEPMHVSGDEYLPIDHVLGANKKRIRLLHPYVLRLRRNIPFQVYKLNKIDTVKGILALPSEDKWELWSDSKRSQRDTQPSGLEDWSVPFGSGSIYTLDHDGNKQSFSIKIRERFESLKNKSKIKLFPKGFKTCAGTNIWHKINISLPTIKPRVRRKTKKYEDSSNRWSPGERDDEKVYDEYELFSENNLQMQPQKDSPIRVSDFKKTSPFIDSDHKSETMEINHKIKKEIINNKLRDEEKNFALYEIGDPDLWYSVQIQLFEKLSTPVGKTVWNDLTKEDIASVSSFNPEWSNDDLNVRYKPINWLARDEFTLPNNSLCLVVPLKGDSDTPVFDKSGDFTIVPFDDIITVSGKSINKRDKQSDNLSEGSTESEVEHCRRVVVRVTRALMGGSAGSLKIISRKTEHFLKLPHTKRHQAQIDIEGRADDNDLVLVGALGRLTTIVSDTTRNTRAILTVQTANTGLAAARFRVLIRECTPELSDDENEKNGKSSAGPELLPPSHTSTFRLTLPIENAIKSAHCVMALVNQDDESVAIRDVRIKRDDRCFCVWHCDCVCLKCFAAIVFTGRRDINGRGGQTHNVYRHETSGEDPKLLCRDMSEAQQVAAGLTPNKRSRHTRSVCYPDVVTINFFVTFIGVLLALLLLGTFKALLGLIFKFVGSCGLHMLLKFPRKLDRYYESSLCCRSVVYDKEGWPVHPDTNQRTVRLVSVPVEFILNVIFFITLPCLMICEGIRSLALHFTAKEKKLNVCCRKRESKKCFSTHDAQKTRCSPRRRRALLRWMTPQAEKLSTDIWTEGLTPGGTTTCNSPLLPTKNSSCIKSNEELVNSVFTDSDEEDTEYVLMQMQKSSESLAKCQQNKDEKSKTQINKRNAAGNKK